LCRGFPVEKGVIKEFDDHDYGVYSDLSRESVANEEYRGFSTSCKVIASKGTCCVSCSSFFHLVIWKRSHKDLNSVIHPNTPKCFLTKDDVVAQLQKERQRRINAEAREKYWRDKFDDEALEVEEQDHDDLSSILLGETVDNVPEDLQCLWKEKLKMVQRKKNGYRWHPK
jgi:hypothetical protein